MVRLMSERVLRCGCEVWTGERCAWSGPASEMVMVEWMPHYFRESHKAAGNRGQYPANGALRIAAEQTCADIAVRSDPEWTSIVGDVPE